MKSRIFCTILWLGCLLFVAVPGHGQDDPALLTDSIDVPETPPAFLDTIKKGGKTYIRLGSDTILVKDKKGQSHFIMKNPEKLEKWDNLQTPSSPKSRSLSVSSPCLL